MNSKSNGLKYILNLNILRENMTKNIKISESLNKEETVSLDSIKLSPKYKPSNKEEFMNTKQLAYFKNKLLI